MKQIPYLHQGSRIAIAAPARLVKRKEVDWGIGWLEKQGFVPVYDERLFSKHYIFAGNDAFRTEVPTIRKAVANVDNVTPCIVSAPGTSCRQQILDGTGVHAVHPIEILYRWMK